MLTRPHLHRDLDAESYFDLIETGTFGSYLEDTMPERLHRTKVTLSPELAYDMIHGLTNKEWVCVDSSDTHHLIVYKHDNGWFLYTLWRPV
jgi:hypothetical protein